MTLPTAATIAEWRKLADSEEMAYGDSDEIRALRQAADACAALIERLQQSENLRSLQEAELSDISDDGSRWQERAEAAEARETALIVERGNLKARIKALEAERDDVARRINSLYPAIEHGDTEHRAWLKAKLDEHFDVARRLIEMETSK